MNKKLFNRLNEQIEVNKIKSTPITESERSATITGLMFGNRLKTLNEAVNTKKVKQED